MGWMEGLLGAGNDSLSQKAAECFQFGKYSEAVKYLNMLIAAEPEESRWLDLKGCCLSKLGKLKEAHTCLEKATRIDPQNAEAWATRGSILLKMGKWQASVDCFERALKVARDLPEITTSWIWHNKGEGLLELGKNADALVAFDKALTITIKAETLVKKGQCLHNLGRFEEAVLLYDEALKLSPGHAEAYLFKACSHDKIGQSESVVDMLEKFISFAQPDDRRVEIAVARIKELSK